jgi:hypothetical protein
MALLESVLIANAVGCTLGPSAFQGVLDHKAALVAKDLGETRDERSLTERLRLKSGIEVTYTVGGCEHLGAKYAYESVPAPKSKDARAMLELTAQLLNDTKLVEGAFDLRRILADAVANILKEERIEQTGDMVVSACGEATCTYTWKAIGKDKVAIEAQYSFAL